MPLDVSTLTAIADICKRAVEDAVAPLRAENEALLDTIAGLEKRLGDTNAVVSQMQADVMAKDDDTFRENVAQDLSKTQQVLDTLTGRLTGVDDAIELLKTSDNKERTALLNRVTALEDAKHLMAEDVFTCIEAHWDDVAKKEVASMIPTGGEEAGHVEKRLDAVEKRIEGAVTVLKEQIKDIEAGPTELQVKEAVRSLWPDIKASMAKSLPKLEHRGVWEAEVQYDVGDEVIFKGSSYRLMHPTDEAPPGDGWQMTSQGRKGSQGKPGPQGDPGERGDAGVDGVGIKDIVIADGKMLVIELTDGTIKDFDLSEFIENIIKALGE